ncbi:hypothetical protein QL285_053585 [Trifolium repens]|nr:hypothetical protein QL285_053585 [Trifolium repens]
MVLAFSQVCLSGFGWLLVTLLVFAGRCSAGLVVGGFDPLVLGRVSSWVLGEGVAGPDLVIFGPVLRCLGGWPVWGVFSDSDDVFDKELWFWGLFVEVWWVLVWWGGGIGVVVLGFLTRRR